MGRCFGDGDPLYAAYHDEEWGRPVRDERGLLELVCLEGFQAGLSWRVVLGRRASLRRAFADFVPEALAAFTEAEVTALLGNPGVIRQRAKIEAAVRNARATLALRAAGRGLPELIWALQPPPRPAPTHLGLLPSSTPESTALARALRGAGFSFVGPTTAYALMQAAGLVNDHLASCPWRADEPADPVAGVAPPPAE